MGSQKEPRSLPKSAGLKVRGGGWDLPAPSQVSPQQPPSFVFGPPAASCQRRHQDKACSCLGLIMTKPNYPEIDSRESESAFPPKRLHVSPPSDRNPGAFSFRHARPVAFHNGAVPRSGRPGHLWKMCGGSRQQSHGTIIFLRLSATPRWRSL